MCTSSAGRGTLSRNYELESLSFNQLVAGELEICTMPDISKQEKRVRLHVLKSLAYFAQTLPQKTLLEVYKATILKVEKGIFSWSNELNLKVENMLDRAVSKGGWRSKDKEKENSDKNFEKGEKKLKKEKESSIQVKSGERVVYCLDYNKNRCEKEMSHEGKFAGKECFKQHICRSCLTIDKEKRYHPEGDDTCPHKSR